MLDSELSELDITFQLDESIIEGKYSKNRSKSK